VDSLQGVALQLGVGCGANSYSLLKPTVIQNISQGLDLDISLGTKRDEVTGEWRRLHIKELYGLYSSPNIIWVIRS